LAQNLRDQIHRQIISAAVIVLMFSLGPNTPAVGFLDCDFFGYFYAFLLIMVFTCLIWNFMAFFNLLVYTRLLGHLSALLPMLIGVCAVLFISCAADGHFLMLTNLVVLCMAYSFGHLFTFIVVLSSISQVLIKFSSFTLIDLLPVSLNCWDFLALLVWHFSAGLLGNSLAHRDFLFRALFLWNLGAYVFWDIVAHFLRSLLTLRRVVAVGGFTHFLVDCFTPVFQFFFAHIGIHSLTLISVLIMTVENFISETNFLVNGFAHFLQFFATSFY